MLKRWYVIAVQMESRFESSLLMLFPILHAWDFAMLVLGSIRDSFLAIKMLQTRYSCTKYISTASTASKSLRSMNSCWVKSVMRIHSIKTRYILILQYTASWWYISIFLIELPFLLRNETAICNTPDNARNRYDHAKGITDLRPFRFIPTTVKKYIGWATGPACAYSIVFKGQSRTLVVL